MKNKFLVFILSIYVVTVFSAGAFAAGGENIRDNIKKYADDIISYKLVSSEYDTVDEWIKDDIALGAGVISDWYAFALVQGYGYGVSAYTNALEKYLDGRKITSVVSAQKYALILLAVNGNEKLAASLAEGSVGGQGIISYVYGLHLIKNGIDLLHDGVDKIVDEITALQRDDGGWSVTGKVSDPDVTAMVLQSLASYTSSDTVKSSVDKAIDFLSEAMLYECDYKSYGVANAESTAQVIIALSALGIDPFEDDRFIKDGKTLFDGLEKYRLPDGSFSHTEGGETNDTATVQALLAYISYLRFLDGKDSLFVLDSTGDETVGTESDTDNTTEESADGDKFAQDVTKVGYKVWVSCTVLGISALVSVVLVVAGKRNPKNFLFIFSAAAVVILMVFTVKLESRDSYYSDTAELFDPVGSVTISINCTSISDKITGEYIKNDGIILDRTSFDIESGDTVYDVLLRAVKKYGIHMESSGGEGMKYVTGISYLYEFDHGDLSGWTYYVNGVVPSVGCDGCKLSDGDVIEWVYTLDLGRAFE